MKCGRIGGAVLSVALLFAASQASASIVTFGNRASWLAATSGIVTNIDFDGAPTGGFIDYGATGLTTGGVTFVGSSNYLFTVDPAYSPSLYDWGSGDVLLGGPSGTITATLPQGVTSFGVDLMSILNYGAIFHVSLSTGESFDWATAGYPTRTFLGVTSSSSISSVSFSTSGAYPELDNFAYAVPEPGTLLLLGGGLLAGARRLRRRERA